MESFAGGKETVCVRQQAKGRRKGRAGGEGEIRVRGRRKNEKKKDKREGEEKTYLLF